MKHEPRVRRAPLPSSDIAWLAGLLEGEGCFYMRQGGKYRGVPYQRYPAIDVAMTDKDVIMRVCAMWNRKVVGMTGRGKSRNKNWQTLWRAGITGTTAIAWMFTVYPFMGARRKAKIREVVAVWRQTPSTSVARSRGAHRYYNSRKRPLLRLSEEG